MNQNFWGNYNSVWTVEGLMLESLSDFENLFLGSSATANNKSALKDLNITHILNVTNCLEPLHLNDIVYKVINERFEFIDEGKRAGGCVFVHCFVGRFRRMTVSQALEYVRSRCS
ncbi:hypothetical protein UlMin_023700 [Ulmus minor]